MVFIKKIFKSKQEKVDFFVHYKHHLNLNETTIKINPKPICLSKMGFYFIITSLREKVYFYTQTLNLHENSILECLDASRRLFLFA